MKKLFSLILAMALTLSMSTAVFAETVNYTATEATTFEQITKTYSSENNVAVSETLSFTSTANTANPDGGAANLSVADLVVSSLTPGKLSVTIPSLSVAGKYEWTIKETPGSAAGVIYSADEIHVSVLVEYNNTDHKLQIASANSYITKENGKKADTFTNTFKSGSFTVAKNVEGNMANENDKFEIKVTLTAPEGKTINTPISVGGTTVAASDWKDGVYTKTLTISKADGKVTFSDIPTGVVVTVNEDTAADKMNGYSYTSTKIGTTDFTSLTIADDTNADIVVTNTNSTSVDTGINMDSVPYIILLAVVFVGLVGFVVKRRSSRY